MTSIPPNIIGAIFQTQVSAAESAKTADAQRNQRARNSRQIARLADQQQHEVEDADQAEGLYVHREDERPRDGQDARDMYEQHASLKENQNPPPENQKNPPSPALPSADPPPPPSHIDLSA